jgi:hypothetical protein
MTKVLGYFVELDKQIWEDAEFGLLAMMAAGVVSSLISLGCYASAYKGLQNVPGGFGNEASHWMGVMASISLLLVGRVLRFIRFLVVSFLNQIPKY